MAITVPIWPGSSSFFPGETPFGFYDTDYAFQTDADKVAVWCAQRLGYPINDIELQDIHFYTCFEEATLEYSNQVNQFNIRDNLFYLQGANTSTNVTGKLPSLNLNRLIAISKNYGTEAGSGGYLTWKTASLAVKTGEQVYDLNTLTFETAGETFSDIEVKKVMHYQPPAISRYFDPFVGTGLGSQQLLEQFGWGAYSPGVSFLLMPMYADLLRLQAIEFNDMVRRSGYGFELTNNRLRLFPVPTYDFTLYIQYINTKDRANLVTLQSSGSVVSDSSNVPYDKHEYTDINDVGRQWIFKYTLALAKEVLGNIRNKYSSIPIPGSEVTLNGADLVSQAQTEKDALITQLRENLDAVSRSSIMEKLANESDQMQQQLTKIPLPFYIG